MLFYTTGVSIAGFSTNIDFMLLARGFQGVGLSMFPIAFSIVRAQFPREKIAIGQGIITSMYGGGAVIGLSVGGAIVQHYGWHATFFTIIPIAITLLFFIWRYIPADKEEGAERTRTLQQQERQIQHHQQDQKFVTSHKNIDMKGAITLAVAVTSFLLVLTYLEVGTGSSTGTDTGTGASTTGNTTGSGTTTDTTTGTSTGTTS